MKIIDLCCGIGGFRQGFEKAGFKTVFSSDIDIKAQDTYEVNFGERPFGDITQICPKEVPDFDVLTAGFPCQPFSISGKKLGFDDLRGTLFFDICRIIDEKQPPFVVFENVKHLIHHDKKRTLNTMLEMLDNLGYNINYKVLNAKDFGLPQNRERIFIIGTKTEKFNFENLRRNLSAPLSTFLDKQGDFEYLDPNEYTLLETNMRRLQPSGLQFVGYRKKPGFKRGIRPKTGHLSRVHRQPNRIYSVEGFHPTLPSQEPSGRFFIYLPSENRVRRLTIDECYRIFGFPDSFVKHPQVASQYKQIGNSICVNIVKEVAREIKRLSKTKQNDAKRKIKTTLFELEKY